MSEIEAVSYEFAHTLQSSSVTAELTAIRALFCAVLERAFTDIYCPSIYQGKKPHVKETIRRQAIAWLTRAGRDFDTVCDLAGVNARVIRKAARESLLAEGQSLRKICSLDGMPYVSTVMDWLARGHVEGAVQPLKGFYEQYMRGREAQAELLFDEIVDIADDSTQDELFTDEGKRVCNAEFVARSKLRVDARKWAASKLLPKRSGDKIQTELSTKDDKPLPIFTLDIGRNKPTE